VKVQTMLANAERGEVSLTLDGADYVLRPTYAACVAIEAQTGRSIIELAVDAQAKSLSLGNAAVIVTECIRAWGREIGRISVEGVQVDRIGELIFADGIAKAMPRIELAMMFAATGGAKAGSRAGDAGEKTPTGTDLQPVGD
jgi:hypothetical protein